MPKTRYTKKTQPQTPENPPVEGEIVTITANAVATVDAPIPFAVPQNVQTLSLTRRQQAIERLAKYRWKPGQTGNPGGISPHELEVRRLCREHSPELITRGLEILQSTDDERVFWVGLGIVLERGFGKPKEIAPEDASAGAPDVSQLSDKELAQLRKLIARAMTPQISPPKK